MTDAPHVRYGYRSKKRLRRNGQHSSKSVRPASKRSRRYADASPKRSRAKRRSRLRTTSKVRMEAKVIMGGEGRDERRQGEMQMQRWLLRTGLVLMGVGSVVWMIRRNGWTWTMPKGQRRRKTLSLLMQKQRGTGRPKN